MSEAAIKLQRTVEHAPCKPCPHTSPR